MTSSISRIALILLGLIAATGARADVLGLYEFTTSTLVSTDADPASVASDIVLGSGLTDTNRFFTTGNASALRVNSDETATTAALSTAAGDFFSVTVTPGSGSFLSLSTLTFNWAVSNVSLTSNLRLQASINGGAFSTVDTLTGFNTNSSTPASIDLSGIAASANDSVSLRFVVFDNGNAANVATLFDSIAVNGTVAAVPEPGAFALIGVGMVGLGWVRRRRQAARA